jgi:hypothetical protein
MIAPGWPEAGNPQAYSHPNKTVLHQLHNFQINVLFCSRAMHLDET